MSNAEKLYELFKDTFIMELAKIDLSAAPGGVGADSELDESEQYMGEMNELEKRIYCLRRHYQRLHRGIHIKLDFDEGTEDELLKLKQSWSLLKQYDETLGNMLWASIRERFASNIPEDHGIGVRHPWKVVAFKQKDMMPPVVKAIMQKMS